MCVRARLLRLVGWVGDARSARRRRESRLPRRARPMRLQTASIAPEKREERHATTTPPVSASRSPGRARAERGETSRQRRQDGDTPRDSPRSSSADPHVPRCRIVRGRTKAVHPLEISSDGEAHSSVSRLRPRRADEGWWCRAAAKRSVAGLRSSGPRRPSGGESPPSVVVASRAGMEPAGRGAARRS